MASIFQKQPAEQYPIAIEFNDKLPSGAMVSSGTVKAEDGGTDVSSTVLGSTIATIVGTQAKVTVKAGTTDKQYKITFLVTLSDNSKLEEEVFMNVKEE